MGTLAAVVADRLPGDLGAGDQIDSDVILVNLDVGMLPRCHHQGPLDLASGDIFGMQDPAGAVAPLTGQVVFIAFGGGGEFNPPFNQIAYGVGPFLHHHSHHFFVTDTGPGHHGVLNMGVKGVFGGED